MILSQVSESKTNSFIIPVLSAFSPITISERLSIESVDGKHERFIPFSIKSAAVRSASGVVLLVGYQVCPQ